MAIRQLSVFAENKNGALYEITKSLAAARIDIRAFSIADTANFGVLRLLVKEPTKAAQVLSENGNIVSVDDVVGVKIPDIAGGLSDILRITTAKNISIAYLYAFVSRETGNAYVILRVDNNDHVEEILEAEGCTLLKEEELH
ncbi:MAG: acetolactate synthase [Ruminococcaceae bacterium]|nr:acetolactate synthase [Oscillospiraceae bacterium]